jgi:hypothetical protein
MFRRIVYNIILFTVSKYNGDSPSRYNFCSFDRNILADKQTVQCIAKLD